MTNTAARVPNTADREDIRGELRRIFDASPFNRSPVMCRLLAFLVEQTMAGNGQRLKAYTIAVDALGREADFDAQSDSYPRVQVGRLRKLLDNFYRENGSLARLRLHIPKGAYEVGFEGPGAGAPGLVDDIHYPVPDKPATRPFDFKRFAAAALLALLIGLLAWQALGGLARADTEAFQPLVHTKSDARAEEYRRCVKVIAAGRCREMVSRQASPNAF